MTTCKFSNRSLRQNSVRNSHQFETSREDGEGGEEHVTLAARYELPSAEEVQQGGETPRQEARPLQTPPQQLDFQPAQQAEAPVQLQKAQPQLQQKLHLQEETSLVRPAAANQNVISSNNNNNLQNANPNVNSAGGAKKRRGSPREDQEEAARREIEQALAVKARMYSGQTEPDAIEVEPEVAERPAIPSIPAQPALKKTGIFA